MSKDEPIQREQMKDLLAFSRQMTCLGAREDLLGILDTQLKKFIDFSCYTILTLSADRSVVRPYISDARPDTRPHTLYHPIITGEHPVKDHVFDTLLDSDRPVVLRIDDLPGFRELAGIRLSNEKDCFGLLILYSDREGRFHPRQFPAIAGIGALVSIGVSTLLASEEIRRREMEREQLLELSHDIAKIQDKQQLLQLINARLKQLFYFKHSNIVVIDHARQTFTSFLRDPASSLKSHPDYNDYQTAHFSIHDILLDKVLNTEEPVIFDLCAANEQGQLPDYLRMASEYGMREIAAIAIPGESAVFGVLSFFTDEAHMFDTVSRKIIKGVASQVATAIANILANEAIGKARLEKEMLLSLSYEMAKVRDRHDLLTIINTRMRNLFYFTHSSISMLNPDGKTFIVYLVDPNSRTRSHPNYEDIISSTYPVHDGIFEKFLSQDEPVVQGYEEVVQMANPPKYAVAHHAVGMKEAVSVRLHGEEGIWGVLHFYSDRKRSFQQDNMSVIRGVASQVAVSISNIQAHEKIREREKEKSLLLSFSLDIAAVRDKENMSAVINRYLKDLLLIREYIITVVNDDGLTHSCYLYDMSASYTQRPEFQTIKDARFRIAGGVAEAIFRHDEPVVLDARRLSEEGEIAFPTAGFWLSAGVDRIMGVPLKVANNNIGILWSHPEQLNNTLAQGMAAQIAIAISNIMAHERNQAQMEEIGKYKTQLEQENFYLQEEINTTLNNSELIGASPAMQRVHRLMSQVANASTTVLILGETGTGKELIARAIHNSSPQRGKLMVKVNCAALPANLIESELFGHEKGSFTGAVDRRIGKFELADNSTLFLDEIGELPPELQAKLLRAIQEKEIERLGGKHTIQVNVRIIAATNRDLQREIAEGKFRSDLYYRLNVFPILLPPLRSRTEDIPALVKHFITRYSRNAGKKIEGVSRKVMDALTAYHWPGNVRELEHLIERSVLLTEGNTIREMPQLDGQSSHVAGDVGVSRSLKEIEREYILAVLKRCKGKIQGIGGASEILQIPATTLHSKMKKLGIKKSKSAG